MKSKLSTHHAAAGDVTFNMVPLVDVAFLLILFFILTSQMASASYAALKLPAPQSCIAVKAQDTPNRVIVNVLSKSNPNTPENQRDPKLDILAKEYKIGPNTFAIGDITAIQRELKARKQHAKDEGLPEKDFFVEIRADERVAFMYVQPVLMAAALEGIPQMKITALTK